MDSKVISTDEIAELLVYLGRAACGGDPASDMTAAQWTALQFFARAKDVSRTPSAFASFYATTRGTASQTIKSLLAKRYLARHESADDRRSVRFDLTDAGLAALRDDPLRALSEAIERLDTGLKSALRQVLPAVVGELAEIRDTVAFGTCGDCRHFAGGAISYCACVAAELAMADLGRLCINFAARHGGKPVSPGAETRKST